MASYPSRSCAWSPDPLTGGEWRAILHDRMPAILAPEGYTRWLSDQPDPRDLMRPFPAGLMRMWPISTRVNKPENDDPGILEPVELASDAA
jgi:putative SOS response-associated peptidase YedK